MEGKISGKVKVPTQRDIKINDMFQNFGDRIHKIDKDKYYEGKIILSSQSAEALHEAILITENFLSYNGSWDFERYGFETGDSMICEIRFKWNGYLSMMDIIRNKLKLPDGVSKELELRHNYIDITTQG
ncbi:MAG: hypothetical protein IJ703_00530 [Eubacterium sp.]|nr:hypothetical protein [Eubacterium sp.]